MPVFLNAKYPGHERQSGLSWPRVQPDALEMPRSTYLHIGLVNNMGDEAMIATEHQFLTLLEAAAGDMLVHLTLYALPEVERKSCGQRRVSDFYSGIEQLWEQPPELYPDGLIVTGREPRAPDLRHEAYWPSFTRVLAWTQEHARSAVWSCLAAHAAVLALDGIERVRSQHKHFGIFSCRQTASHTLLAGAPKPSRSSLALEWRLRRQISRERLPGAHAHQRRRRRHVCQARWRAVRVLPGPSGVPSRDAYGRIPSGTLDAILRERRKLTRCCRWTISRKRRSGLWRRLKRRHGHRATRSSSARSLPCSAVFEFITLGAVQPSSSTAIGSCTSARIIASAVGDSRTIFQKSCVSHPRYAICGSVSTRSMETLMPPASKWEDSMKSQFPETRSFSANPTKRPNCRDGASSHWSRTAIELAGHPRSFRNLSNSGRWRLRNVCRHASPPH